MGRRSFSRDDHGEEEKDDIMITMRRRRPPWPKRRTGRMRRTKMGRMRKGRIHQALQTQRKKLECPKSFSDVCYHRFGYLFGHDDQ